MKIKLFTIPNMLTLSNLLCGSFAVIATLVYNDIELAFWLMILAAVFDFFDGFAARLLKCPSEIGVQLDSLADMVSFGFLPSAMLFTIYSNAYSLGLWSDGVGYYMGFVVFVVVAFSALRLAKFNIDDTQTTEFVGMPTPACAMFCASMCVLVVREGITLSQEYILVMAIVVATLLISPIRMFSLKFHGFGWSGNELRYIFLLLSIVAIVVLKYFAIPVIIAGYVLISTVRWVLDVKHNKTNSCGDNCCEK